jgi:hypothetical protein
MVGTSPFDVLSHPDIITDFARMSPEQHLVQAQRMLDRHINACPSGEERNALTEANIMLLGLLMDRGKVPVPVKRPEYPS